MCIAVRGGGQLHSCDDEDNRCVYILPPPSERDVLSNFLSTLKSLASHFVKKKK